MSKRIAPLVTLVVPLALAGCGDDAASGGSASDHRLYVGHSDGTIASYDLANGQQRPGELTGVTAPTDLQALANGTLVVNAGGTNQTVALDGRTMLRSGEPVGSGTGGTRPVHGYLSPVRGDRQFYLALYDGTGTAATNSAAFVDVSPESPTYLQRVGETPLGVGHHKAAFSATRTRVVVSSIADCADAIAVLDYSDPADVQRVATFGATDLGVAEGACPAGTTRPAPHGCTTSKISNKVYCNLTGTGAIAVVDVDAATPAVTLLETDGRGGGYMKASQDGFYVYAVQTSPREGQGGLPCQIGRLLVLHVESPEHPPFVDAVVAQVPLFYGGCDRSVGLPDEVRFAAADHLALAGNRLFVSVGGEPPPGTTLAAREVLVVDVTNPLSPPQRSSIAIGAHSGHRTQTVSGDGRFVFTVNGPDNTVSQIDVATLAVVRTIPVRSGPRTLATFGSAEGPSVQIGPIH